MTKTYRTSDAVDFAIVGSGAAGGVLARELVAGRLLGRRAGAGPAADAGRLRARRAQVLVQLRHHQRCSEEPADVPRRSFQAGRAQPDQAIAVLRADRRRQQHALHGELLALSRSRLRRALAARTDRRHRLRRLADQLRRAGAVLHEGRVGDRRQRAGGRASVRSAAQQALSDAASAREVLGRAARARCAQAGSAPVPGAAGDQLAALSRPSRVRSLRFLSRLRLRSGRKSFVADDDDSGGRGDRTLRGPFRKLRRAGRHRQERTCHGRALLRSRQARTISEGEGGHRGSERRGNAAPVADVGEQHVPARARELERARRQVPDVQLQRAHARGVRARAQRVQERAGHAGCPRLLRQRSEARLLRRRWHRRAHGSAADCLGGPHRQ